jgi:hypothetical protein
LVSLALIKKSRRKKKWGRRKAIQAQEFKRTRQKLSLLVSIALSGIGTWRDFDSL